LSCPIYEEAKLLKKIDRWVKRILFENISPAINDEVPSWAQEGLQYRLMTFLCETLRNVFEHAETKFAAVYVRYREGKLGESPDTWQRLSLLLEREENNNIVPLMKLPNVESFPNTRTGFFEVFVIDAGQGLGSHLPENKNNPIHKTMLNVFKCGISSKENKLTEHGGLHLIDKLLTPNKDYLRVRDEDVWWATQLPLKDKHTLDAYGKEYGNKEMKGLAWTARLSWLTQDAINNSLWHEVDVNAREELLNIYRYNESAKNTRNILNIPIYDARFPYSFSQKLDKSINKDTALLFLPSPKLMRSHIQNKIESLFNEIPSIGENFSLVIGDIPSEEATTYVAAINNAHKFKGTIFQTVRRVVLITRALRVYVLTRNNPDALLMFNSDETNSYISSKASRKNLFHRSLPDYLCVLRKHDGNRLIKMIRTQKEHAPYMDFLAEKVDWHNELILNGYLDFPQTLINPLFRAIYALSLQRLIGLYPEFYCKLSCLKKDKLAASIVTQFNAQIPSRPPLEDAPQTQFICIGSVKVSDSIEKSEGLVFYFFRHPNGKASGLFLLPWIKPPNIKNLSSDRPQFQRVGKTSVIARDGWKSYLFQRFIESSPTEHKSAYEKNPRDSYQAWQESSRNPMKLGHWSYGGHHEILTINLRLAFDTELDRIGLELGGSLARFIYANFFRIFDIQKADLKEQNKILLEKIKNDKYQHLFSQEDIGKNALLVYPSHPVTDHIIECFLDLLTRDTMQTVRSRLIGILPIRLHRSGSGLQVSGITLERLRLTKNKDTTPVVFFDDGVISGRTYEEVKRLLRSIGYRDVYSLLLLDRQRLPSVDYLEDGKHICYWRLDVPSLGGKAHCPLCHAIDRVTALSDSIVSQAHRDRIDSWCDSWKELDPSTEWGATGLRPISLTLKKPERRFGIIRNANGSYRQIGGDDQQICLTNSAGLIAWVTELYTITSHDDCPAKLLENEVEALSTDVRIQLLSSQLLLFFGEFAPSYAQNLGEKLMEALWDSKESDRHTALAVLTLISCGDEFLKGVMDKFLNSGRLSLLKDKHIDFVLLTALKLAVARRNSGQLKKDQGYDVANRLLKPCDKPDLYYRLHREIKDALGAAHSTPLHNLVKSAKSFEIAHFMDSLGSAAQLLALIDEIQRYWLRPNTDAFKNYTTINSNIKQEEERLRTVIKKFHTPPSDENYHDVKEKGKLLLAEGGKLHAGLFISLNDITSIYDGKRDTISCLPSKFGDDKDNTLRIIKWREPIFKNPNPAAEANTYLNKAIEVFVVWDTQISDAVKDILSNVRHVESVFNIDESQDANATVHLWCQIQKNEFCLDIEMQNRYKYSKTSDEFAKLKERTNNHHSHHCIREIGGNVTYDLNENILLTTVSLPYAHTLQTIFKDNNYD
jgi:hypothetical protein